MRSILSVEHRSNTHDTLTHVVTAPHETIALIRVLGATGLAWPALFAAAACRCVAHAGPPETFVLTTAGPPPALQMDRAANEPSFVHYYAPRRLQQGYGADIDGPLNTWVFAPIRQA
jgi:hypothetical protein